MKLFFPQNFLWGAATASHQVEGNCVNNWSEWERSSFRFLALEKTGERAKYGEDNFISALACDHYHKYQEDFCIAKDLGHNATRISLEWSRIEPQKGVFDENELKHYQEVLSTLRSLGIEVLVTLHHWTIPLWLEQEGGWESSKAPGYFSSYAKKVALALPDVKFWITLNEPEIFTMNSYYRGVWPPQKKSFLRSFRVLHNLIFAHKKAYKIMKEIHPQSQIGIAKNNTYFEVARNTWKNILLKKIADYFWNEYFLNRILKYQDYIGINYYFHNRIDKGFGKNKNEKVSDLGWELYPEGMYHVLKDLQKYGTPIYITENGLADESDQQRAWFIEKTLCAVHRAMSEGVDVRGYLHWSLMDNFEWEKGFWPRFGLVEIDYTTLERHPRKSALYYKMICQNNYLEIEN